MLEIILQVVFGVLTLASLGLFGWQVSKIRNQINLGKDIDRTDSSGERLKKTILIAFGQKKMFKNMLPAVMHLFIYVAFLITQIELIEIFVDGFAGTHRFFMPFLGGFYTFIISFIEILSLLALVATVVFLARRNLLKVPRLVMPEMKGWPKLDGNIILYVELILVTCIFTMNGADEVLLSKGASHAHTDAASFGFAISSWLGPALFGGLDVDTLHVLERVGWWGHILVVLGFLNYLPISKHFHIIFAFPNTYFSNLEPVGKLNTVESITTEIKAMMDPSFTPPADMPPPSRFGAKDVEDLVWPNLMDAYTCTECGRCSAVCPANQTGKKLSPRKIIMDTRDRLEELKKAGSEPAAEVKENSLLGNFITPEELWACTTCNACTEACPVSIDHVTQIVEMRRFMVMEESSAPFELNAMFQNMENNGCPWPMPASSRFDWSKDIEMPANLVAAN